MFRLSCFCSHTKHSDWNLGLRILAFIASKSPGRYLGSGFYPGVSRLVVGSISARLREGFPFFPSVSEILCYTPYDSIACCLQRACGTGSIAALLPQFILAMRFPTYSSQFNLLFPLSLSNLFLPCLANAYNVAGTSCPHTLSW